MKIPKYVAQALERRVRLAEQLEKVSYIVDDFIIKNGLEDEIEYCDYGSGVEIYVNPKASAERVRQAIINHKK